MIDTLLDVLGYTGTLMMSAITTKHDFVVACIAASDRGTLADVAPFDIAKTPTYAGKIAETFRNRSGVQRSWHPTHSVTGIGPRAGELLANHDQAPGPCGEGTPYTRLTYLDRGLILLLGVSHMSNTTLHGSEELAEVEYVNYPKWARIPLITPGGPREAHTRVHNTHMPRNLNVFETAYIDAKAQTVTHVGESCLRLVHAKTMSDVTVSKLRKDPMAMLNDQGRRAWAKMKETGDFITHPQI